MVGKGGVENSTCINNNSSDSSPGGHHCHLDNKMEIESKIMLKFNFLVINVSRYHLMIFFHFENV